MGNRGHNRHGRKEEGIVPLRGQLGPRLIQCGLCRGLLPYQVTCSFIQPFGHNRHGPKIRWGGCVLFLELAGSPSNTKSPEPRPTSMPTGTLVYTAVRPQRTMAENWAGCAPLGEGSWVPSNTMSRRPTPTSVSSGILIHEAVWPQ